MESLTACQAHRTRVGVRTVTRDTAGPGMESLTDYQAHKIRVEVRTVTRVIAGPGMKSLTTCQGNRTRVGVKTEKGYSWTWHGITHFLSSQQDQSGSEDSEKGHNWT